MRPHSFCIFLINLGLKVGLELNEVYQIVEDNLTSDADKIFNKILTSTNKNPRWILRRIDFMEFLWACQDALKEIKLSN